MTCKLKPTLLTLSCFLEGEIFVSNSNREVGVFWFQSNQRRMNLKSCHIKLIVYNIYEAVFNLHISFLCNWCSTGPARAGSAPTHAESNANMRTWPRIRSGIIYSSHLFVSEDSQSSQQTAISHCRLSQVASWILLLKSKHTSMSNYVDVLRRLNSKRKLFPWNCVVIYHKKGGCVEKNNKRARARFAGFFSVKLILVLINIAVDK